MRKNGQKLVDLGAISPIRRGRSEFYRIENQEELLDLGLEE